MNLHPKMRMASIMLPTLISNNDYVDLMAAEERGNRFRESLMSDVLRDIHDLFINANVVTHFRRALFNGRQAVVNLQIPRWRHSNNVESDEEIDIHQLLLDGDGYNLLVDRLDHIRLAYNIDNDTIYFKLTFITEVD